MVQGTVNPQAQAIATALVVCLITVDPSGCARSGATAMLRKVLIDADQLKTDATAMAFLHDILSAMETFQ
jgi:hypothetical protein